MEIAFRVFDTKENKFVSDPKVLMEAANLDHRMGYESIAVQEDGTTIVCDKCGQFGYLDVGRYQLSVMYK